MRAGALRRVLALLGSLAFAASASAGAPPPDPWPLLYGAAPRTPPLDAPFEAVCRTPERVAALDDGRRRAVTRPDLMRERERLAPLAVHGEDELTRACAALTSGRIALALGLHPEAAAEALEAGREAEPLGDPLLLAAARFVRAEALLFSGRRDAAFKTFDELAKLPDPRFAAAARLRVTEIELERGHVESARAAFRELLGPQSPLVGVSLGPFALRAAEAAWAEGDAGEAARWIEQALGEKLDPPHWIAATLRRADLLEAAGRHDESERQLASIEDFEPDGPAGLLIGVRRVARAMAHPPVDTQELLAQLAPAMAAPDASLAAYARSVGAELRIRAADPTVAFEELVPLLTEPRSVARLGLAQVLDDVLLGLIESGESCEKAIALVDPQRSLVVRSVSRAEPLAALGDCYQKVGLVEPAFAILRAVTERFGPEVAALPFARASLRAGAFDVAASAAHDRLDANAPDAAAWKLLLAEVELARGDPKSAEALLVPLVIEPGRDRAHAIGLLAEAAGSGETSGAAVDALVRGIRMATDADWECCGEPLGDAALGTANLLRRAGRERDALELYTLASVREARQPSRAEAFYWRGRLAAAPDEVRAQLRASVAANGGPWSQLAQSRLALLDLGRKPIGSKRS